MKLGGSGLAGVSLGQLFTHPELWLRNWPLLGGYFLYGISTVLLVLALRKGELSILYPIISLTYVWVLALSALVFKEQLNFWKIGGVLAIVAGVGVLGRDGRAR
jgi:multidrug transporter EmrE-like cation transporter